MIRGCRGPGTESEPTLPRGATCRHHAAVPTPETGGEYIIVVQSRPRPCLGERIRATMR